MYPLGKQIVRQLRGKPFFFRQGEVFQGLSQSFAKLEYCLRAFYFFTLFYHLMTLEWHVQFFSKSSFLEPLWPFALFSSDSIATFSALVCYSVPIAAAFACFNPKRRVYRLAYAFLIFLFVGLKNSDGHYGHDWHALLWIALIFSFLPNLNQLSSVQKRSKMYYSLVVFSFSQLAIGIFYLLTGIWKIEGILHCALDSQLACQLDEYILTNISAQEAIHYYQFAPFRDFFFEYPWVSFFSYVATIWIHIASLYFVFRPDLHRLFGFLRLIFHLGTFLFFGVNFSVMAIAVSLIFFFSPFDRIQGPSSMAREFLRLPPFHLFFRGQYFRQRALFGKEEFQVEDFLISKICYSHIFLANLISIWRWESLVKSSTPSQVLKISVGLSCWLGTSYICGLLPQKKSVRMWCWLIFTFALYLNLENSFLSFPVILAIAIFFWVAIWDYETLKLQLRNLLIWPRAFISEKWVHLSTFLLFAGCCFFAWKKWIVFHTWTLPLALICLIAMSLPVKMRRNSGLRSSSEGI